MYETLCYLLALYMPLVLASQDHQIKVCSLLSLEGMSQGYYGRRMDWGRR